MDPFTSSFALETNLILQNGVIQIRREVGRFSGFYGQVPRDSGFRQTGRGQGDGGAVGSLSVLAEQPELGQQPLTFSYDVGVMRRYANKGAAKENNVSRSPQNLDPVPGPGDPSSLVSQSR